jgi:hypothetical protein
MTTKKSRKSTKPLKKAKKLQSTKTLLTQGAIVRY